MFGVPPYEANLIAGHPDKEGMRSAMHQLNSHIGAHNDRLNKEFQSREDEFKGKLKVGDMILVRNLPKENARMGLKYRKNIYKIIERKGRKIKAIAQFKGLELVTIHVKNAKLFRYNKELQFLPDSIKKFFIAPPFRK